MMLLESLNIYPIKSAAGVPQDSARVEPRGLVDDRRYLLVDAQGKFITGRRHGDLVLVHVSRGDDHWILDAPAMQPLVVKAPDAATKHIDVRIWHDEVVAQPVSERVDRWFTKYLGTPCRLVYQDPKSVRFVAPARRTRETDEVSFADGYPVLLIGSASLHDLNSRLTMPMPMSRFRTNLVAGTTEAFEEDRWQRIRIGEVEFDVVKRCARCVFTTVDPLSGQKDPLGEPLKTLRSYRLDKIRRGVMFGVNLVPRNVGEIKRGSPIDVIEID